MCLCDPLPTAPKPKTISLSLTMIVMISADTLAISGSRSTHGSDFNNWIVFLIFPPWTCYMLLSNFIYHVLRNTQLVSPEATASFNCQAAEDAFSELASTMPEQTAANRALKPSSYVNYAFSPSTEWFPSTSTISCDQKRFSTPITSRDWKCHSHTTSILVLNYWKMSSAELRARLISSGI